MHLGPVPRPRSPWQHGSFFGTLEHADSYAVRRELTSEEEADRAGSADRNITVALPAQKVHGVSFS